MVKILIAVWTISVIVADFLRVFIHKKNVIVRKNIIIMAIPIIIGLGILYKFIEKPYNYVAIGAVLYLSVIISYIVSYVLANKGVYRVCNLKTIHYNKLIDILEEGNVEYEIFDRKWTEYILSLKGSKEKNEEVVSKINEFINSEYSKKERIINYLTNSLFWSILVALLLYFLFKE